jgi:hypothetical protein
MIPSSCTPQPSVLYRPATFEAFKRDEHFLSRLDRLSQHHVERALVLYRDSELVKRILQDLNVSDSVTRVAISLHHPVRGPFVIVTRSGHFVTCLGEGMSVNDLPIIEKEQFERTARQLQRIRDIWAETALYPKREIRRVIKRLYTCGPHLSREDFEAIAAWQPILIPDLFESYLKLAVRQSVAHVALVRRENYRKPRDENTRLSHWADTWAMMHLRLLIGVDNGRYLRILLEYVDIKEIEGILCDPARFNLFSYAVRTVWLSAKIGKLLTSSQKQRYLGCAPGDALVNPALVLSAMGHAHHKLQNRVSRILATEGPFLGGAKGNSDKTARLYFSREYEARIIEPEGAKTSLENFAIKATSDFDRELTLESRIALVLRMHSPICGSERGALPRLFDWLPWIVRAKASDFYLVREQMKRVYSPRREEEAISLVEPSRVNRLAKLQYIPNTIKNKPSPGRNDPCSCGSGKKFKFCCAH